MCVCVCLGGVYMPASLFLAAIFLFFLIIIREKKIEILLFILNDFHWFVICSLVFVVFSFVFFGGGLLNLVNSYSFLDNDLIIIIIVIMLFANFSHQCLLLDFHWSLSDSKSP